MISKKEVLDNLEEVKKYVKEAENEKETKRAKIEIKTFGGSVLFESEKSTLKEAVEEAVEGDADLGGAYLGGAYLGDADLRGAYLGGKGTSTKLKKSDVEDFHKALGIVVEE